MKVIITFTSLLVWAASCTTNGPGSTLFRANTPHEQYQRSLKTAQLDETALGIDWAAAADRALLDSLKITVPYRESGYFSATKPVAVGYRIDGSRGDKLTIRVEVQGREAGRVFIDVFSLGNATPDLVAFAKANADSNATAELVWEPRRTQTHLIRIQPELLRSGRYTISVTRDPVLSFPVKGRTSRQISSYFGVARDGGRRRHEGIDIFAPRGTPAVASVDGVISRVGVNELGGNVVFLTDNDRQQRLYYAHLDRFNVTDGQRVSIGDTVGFIGNTGNARTTGPHLHFGIYSFNKGAVDPLPFVRLGPGPARQELPAVSLLGDSVRLTTTRGQLRLAPGSDSPVLTSLSRQQFMTVQGGTANWLRVLLPNGQAGYVAKGSFESIEKPVRSESINVPTPLLDEAHPAAAVITTLSVGTSVRVLAQLPNFLLVRGETGQTGWLLRPSRAQ
ncbi:peptidoglycan DD-metalloendopeptidase family protein [Fibrella aquatica]|uniref:peptidoglycan DD-metalloendopeptidase family protein n=1 Tax=Fibrella aquatica TaxID=3242487 RepID=UPI0035203BEE